MSSIINTNSLSLLTQNNLTKSQAALNTSIERLSSGLRINSAKDDSAGQAIANRFTATIKGLSQAQRNANDGISLAQTTEGALNEVNNNLQRVRELSVQAANGSNSADDKASIQSEIKQRMAEIDRISEQTDFNGTKVLSQDSKLNIQIGAKDGETIAIDLKEISSDTLKMSGFNVNGPQGDMATLAGATEFEAAYGATTQVASSTTSEATADVLAGRLGIAGTGVAISADTLVDEAGNLYAEVSVTAADQNESDNLKAKGFDVADGDTVKFYIALDAQNADLTDPAIADFVIDTAAISLSDLKSGATGSALAVVDNALKIVDDLRGALGAVQNRFDSVISNLGTTVTNLSSSRSRIEDADYATEVSNMTRAQILQQAGTSVLAKANQSTEGVMSLLR